MLYIFLRIANKHFRVFKSIVFINRTSVTKINRLKIMFVGTSVARPRNIQFGRSEAGAHVIQLLSDIIIIFQSKHSCFHAGRPYAIAD